MRKTTVAAVALVALSAILFCCLIAGTPVNNDPSAAAEVAGIHLSPQPSQARTSSALEVVLAAATLVLVVAMVLRPYAASIVLRRWQLDHRLPPWLRAPRGVDRRGPPLLAR